MLAHWHYKVAQQAIQSAATPSARTQRQRQRAHQIWIPSRSAHTLQSSIQKESHAFHTLKLTAPSPYLCFLSRHPPKSAIPSTVSLKLQDCKSLIRTCKVGYSPPETMQLAGGIIMQLCQRWCCRSNLTTPSSYLATLFTLHVLFAV